ncbi:MAG: hypothetical protein K6F23_03030 [Solobacterium sp.]|nr:hypothetical protein [Solobacterium sp.]
MDNRREQIIDIIKREFIGPDPLRIAGLIQENGEEILSSDPPTIRYAAGILFPQNVKVDQVESDTEVESIGLDQQSKDTVTDEPGGGVGEFLQEAEELINLSNAYQQSAISMTVAVCEGDHIFVNVRAGAYTTVSEKDATTGKEKRKYYRSQITWDNTDFPIQISETGRIEPQIITCNTQKTALKFHTTFRYKKDSKLVYTFTLENSKMNKASRVKDDDCYFQVEFSLISQLGFQSMPNDTRLNINDEDYLSNQMLYRNVKKYAVGHGCAAEWTEIEGKVNLINTAVFPSYEMKPIVPNVIDKVSLEMYRLSDAGRKEDILLELRTLCMKYEEWIIDLSTRVNTIADHGTALRHIENCRFCLRRMEDGIDLLERDDLVLLAFQLMNRAMLLQQLHYGLPLQKWESEKGQLVLQNAIKVFPSIHDKETWGENKNRLGRWRPFQLAFVLMNLKSMYDRTCNERSIVDLIWFPTGGGKTEAYLGLSAYTIFIRRLMNRDDSGTTILMRYTLRLLTSQQYERASSLICACELIRQEMKDKLGVARISIGLWVGSATTPNSMTDAVRNYEKLYRGETAEHNPFIVMKCPWCGAEMGLVQNGKTKDTPGYKKIISKGSKRLVLQCRNSLNNCAFSKTDNTLPLYIVDDDIYSNTPTLLLGTVDKFASLPYRPEAQTIFGIHDGKRVTSPDLIIQDELHLISGPLGSMVGHYETMIYELCSYETVKGKIQPKIIASTATISRAAEQCNALYGCGKNKVRQFPPAGLDAGDSFFAVEDKKAPGRKYVGILASGASSMATTAIRLYATLLYAGKAIKVGKEADRDPYWTNVGYFNSIRELGQLETWIPADINEYLHVIYKRRYEDKEEGYIKNRRYLNAYKELTSRISSNLIPATLQELGERYPSNNPKEHPLDICLATNMISVGVDVPRLGLMTVDGQPKTTSEYIQATSRVGRRADAPGLVLTLYNPGKPRDKSHYEQFVSYHSRIYCNVEPTSVTPFSAPLRDRALHALVIGIIRQEGDKYVNANPPSIPDEETRKRVKAIICDRVAKIDCDELEDTMRQIDDIFDNWSLWEPEKYHDYKAGDELPLIFPAGTRRNELWGESRGYPTPTSMRSVDASCEAKVIENGYSVED